MPTGTMTLTGSLPSTRSTMTICSFSRTLNDTGSPVILFKSWRCGDAFSTRRSRLVEHSSCQLPNSRPKFIFVGIVSGLQKLLSLKRFHQPENAALWNT